jgi:hypothetical protein
MSDLTCGVGKTMGEPVNVFAPWALGRSLIETCGLLVWLLAPGLSPEDRIGRDLTLRLENFRERRKWAVCGNAPGDVGEMLDRADQRLSEIAEDLGIAPKMSRRDELLGYGCTKPGPTELARDLGWEEEYRLESGIVYGFHWATSAAGLRERDAGYMRVTTEPTLMLSVLSGSVVRYLRGTGALFAYMGWDMHALATEIDPLLDSVGLRPALRPWVPPAP